MKKRIFSLLLALCLVVGMLPTVAYAYNNGGGSTIDSGTFDEEVSNAGIINGGTFNNTVTNTPGSYINNGTFNGIVYSRGGCKITGGTFNNEVNNDSGSDYILGGTFNDVVNNNGGAKIQGGVFNGTVNNNSLSRIQDGTFYATVNNNNDSYITGGTFYDKVINGYQISGGTFYGDVENNKTITGGTFYGTVTGSGTIKDSAKVTVTFDSDNGNAVQEEKVLKGQKVSAPTNPTRAGYSFEGWYQGDTEFDFANTPVTENITLTAKWTVDRVKLTQTSIENFLKYDSGSYYYGLPNGNYYLGENILLDDYYIDIGSRKPNANVTLDLNGFELRNDSDINILLYLNNSSTLTLTDSSSRKSGKAVNSLGGVIDITLNATFNANGGTVEGNVRILNNAEIKNTDPSDITVFTGEVINLGTIKGGIFTGTVSGGTIEDSAKVTVTFDSNGGDSIDEQKVLRGQKASAPTDPTRVGYSFEGWYNGDTEFDFANTPVTENITLTAKWVVGTKLTKTILDNTYGEVSPTTGDLLGYRLPSGHYYLGDNISVDAEIDIGDGLSAADVTLDLKGYELKKESGTEPLLGIYCLGDDFTTTLTLIDSSSAKTGKVISRLGIAVLLSINSQLNANGGTVEGDVKLSADYPAVIDNTDPSNVTEFTGSVENGGTIKGGIFTGTVSGSGTIEDSAKVTVSFDSDNAVQEDKVLRGQKVTAPTEPSKAGYSFNGWYNGNTAFDFTNTPVIENITLTAKWVEKSDITLNTASQSYTYDNSAQAFSITGTAVTGFDISYKQNGQTVTNPTNAGSYDVTITRAEDNTYKAVDVTISSGLVINPATPTENSAKKTTARVVRGRTLPMQPLRMVKSLPLMVQLL